MYKSYLTKSGDLGGRVFYIEAGELKVIKDGEELADMRKEGLIAPKPIELDVGELHRLRVRYGHTK